MKPVYLPCVIGANSHDLGSLTDWVPTRRSPLLPGDCTRSLANFGSWPNTDAFSSNNMNLNHTINIEKAEQHYGVVKRYINTLMNLTGAPAHCWLLCLLYVCILLNVTASPALGGLTPIPALTGQVPDISHFLHFLEACLL